ncbi:Glucose 1-dehydrogenase 2 [Flavobacterium bizetiae]|uniref:Glucose 1-dehydrogenase 2 n=1 Tax=Flavobacterium bizetiae TaxID=2704140 RepID=A0A6J4G8K1_9FLAO|nr:SDR family oxidoreductase [Flavobacterium bizetiae]CAA9195034.1 Glucose 1-dehydrogenase 2 [Flavobacterium bizetiae]CAD5340946.1 Glucose 1-dehydrogenase 2 [Flavobacterium bizetiae]CAD5347373.1 Glucose 1-dehydrogenase 2 [Flavobacterium bizetiae]
MKNLKNKVALITGSARGLGKAIAERYAALGADIVINYSKDKASADEVLSNVLAMGVKAIAIKADVSKVADLEYLFEEAKKAFGKIDIVVANAGIEMVEVPVTEFTEEQFDKVFSINTKGTYFTLQQAAKHVENNGRIIYIASSTTSFPVPGMAVYGGSKTTPRYLVDILSKEIGHKGITVNSIIPFAVDHSGIFAEANSYPELRKQLLDSCPMQRLAEVEDVANVAEFFASDLSSFVNGQHLLVNGGATN